MHKAVKLFGLIFGISRYLTKTTSELLISLRIPVKWSLPDDFLHLRIVLNQLFQRFLAEILLGFCIKL